ncbi:hypothetical protein ACFWYW_24270 [Nonomuraea sp. NPDC059023]|uniref:hypothetical protein n=1 Tax=unclassified Nonomuraea TaxID=2593643 RepID=UPI0036999BE4
MSSNNDSGLTSTKVTRTIQAGTMLAALCVAGLSLGDQSQLAASVGWNGMGGTQAYLLPGGVILLEAVTLVVWSVAQDRKTRNKAFWFSVLATLVSYSLNVIWNRIHNGYAEQTEALVWYLSAVPSIAFVAAMKVGSLLVSRKPNPHASASDEAATSALPTDRSTPLPEPEASEEAHLPDLPPQVPALPESEEPIIRPVPANLWDLPRRTVMLCLREIAERRLKDPEDDLEGMTGPWLKATYGSPSERSWTAAKREALELWTKDADGCLELLGAKLSA